MEDSGGSSPHLYLISLIKKSTKANPETGVTYDLPPSSSKEDYQRVAVVYE